MPTKHLTHVTLPSSLKDPLLIDSLGRPRYWATIWQTLYGAHLAASTLSTRLLDIEALYTAAEICHGEDCLDRLLTEGALDEITSALESLFVTRQNRAAAAGNATSGNWRSAFEFVAASLRPRVGDGRIMPNIEDRLSRLERLHKNFIPANSTQKRPAVRALPADVVEEFYVILDPNSPQNPFRTEKGRWRNYAMFLLYLHQGLRRGEALLLPSNAINQDMDPKTGELRYWLTVVEPDGDTDPRQRAPSFKTALSRRQVPISPEITSVVEHYVDNFRGRQDTPFMFVSNQRKPLALNSVNLAFEAITGALSEKATKSLKTFSRKAEITPHDLRHTCAVFRLREFVSAGVGMEEALQLLRAFFGWSPSSDMPRHYARAYFEDRLADIWRHGFDDRVDLLRQLREIERNAGMADAT